jgi:hypothetical protein
MTNKTKPIVHNQGKVIAEIDEDGGVLILYPDGEIVGAGNRDTAERKIKIWAKRNQHRNAINVATIEWRESAVQQRQAAYEAANARWPLPVSGADE